LQRPLRMMTRAQPRGGSTRPALVNDMDVAASAM
jgi:hypothetical protein